MRLRAAESISAVAIVPAPPARVFALLGDLREHWRLAGRWIDVLSLDRSTSAPGPGPDGGLVRMRGPLGIGRTVRTRVVRAEPVRRLEGVAEVGRRTRARISWTLTELHGSTEVSLAATVEEAGLIDRLLLAVGGRAWLRRRLAATLARLSASVRQDERELAARALG
jgi:hypothetical protein